MPKDFGIAGPHNLGDKPEALRDLPRCFRIIGLSSALLTAALTTTGCRKNEDATRAPLTPSQIEIQNALVYRMPISQGLPVIQCGDRVEIDTLDGSRKDGCYVFYHDGIVVYKIMQFGVSVESDTFQPIW
ncbi:MAG: hypothetical protein WC753_02125 [Candidatus Gracilibacteria bacterium]